MIPASTAQKNAPEWQRELAEAVRDPRELLALLGLDPADLQDTGGGFPLRVPRGYVARMRPGDRHDPLLAQVLPVGAERHDIDGFVSDPVADRDAMARPGVLHKYHGRVLLVTTGACGIHCRYCFRREFPYRDANPRPAAWHEALEYVAARPEVEEVILSGGDPLSLADATLADLAERIAAIGHVRTIRLHTRMPVVLPARVDCRLCAWLADTPLEKVVVLHANHAAELDNNVAAACRRLAGAGATLLNQSVLLRAVNDTANDLATLSRRLFACGVLPYYLHLLDPVRGAARFDVPVEAARSLLSEMAGRLPGYLVPRLVREEPGRPGKTPIAHRWESLPARRDQVQGGSRTP